MTRKKETPSLVSDKGIDRKPRAGVCSKALETAPEAGMPPHALRHGAPRRAWQLSHRRRLRQRQTQLSTLPKFNAKIRH